MSLGTNIKKYRRELGLTQEELADILNVTGQAVSKWESENGLPDTAQIVPLAKALNVTTDVLFGFKAESYDVKYADEVWFQATTLRDTGNQVEGAVRAADFLNEKCEEDIFNYKILARYVQAIAHMSRFIENNGLFKDEPEKWQTYVRLAENRAQQVIRYSDESQLADICHYALAWLYWHMGEYEKGLEHVNALPSIGSNMLRETIAPYYVSVDPQQGLEGWSRSVRDNYQNFVRAVNKQFVYTAESMMWKNMLEQVEENCQWAMKCMDSFCENEVMKPFCQGFYRDTVKYLVAAYLRNGMPEKAAEQWNALAVKTDEYLALCDKLNSGDKADVLKRFGGKGAENISRYTSEFVESKRAFMLGQLKSWCDDDVFASFSALIGR